MSVACGPCAVGYHPECWNGVPGEDCCCGSPVMEQQQSMSLSDALMGSSMDVEVKERGGQIKDFANVKDLESTGRKRAAKLYPIPKEGAPGYPMRCEWAGLLQAGGGVIPIVGCHEGFAKAIHHGPDKNTLSNFVGNVHRICATCHNRWHTINDGYYSGERPMGDVPYVPLPEYEYGQHNANLKASADQLAMSEAAWAMKDAKGFLSNLFKEVN